MQRTRPPVADRCSPLRVGLRLAVVWLSLVSANTQSLPLREPTQQSFVRHLKFLASDDMKGRGNGTPELDRAAEYIADNFFAAGLEGPFDGDYQQPFEVPTGFIIGPENAVTFFATPDQAQHLRFGLDYHPVSYQEWAPLQSAPLVFAGFGISAPELGYDDYASLEVEGSVVVVYEHEPQEHSLDSIFEGNRLSDFSSAEYKAYEARRRGAAALILLPDSFNHYRDSGSFPPAELENMGLNVIRLSESWAARLMEVSGHDIRQIRRSINRELTPYSFVMPSIQAVVRLDVTVIRKTVRNVVGIVPGRIQESIVIGAHYDHLGLGGIHSLEPKSLGTIHNGADDNASGVAALLELSRWFSRYRPHHTLIFVAFAGEELGLLGSQHYTAFPVVPLDQTVAMINMDMIGRSQGDLLIGGVGTAVEFRELLEAVGNHSSLRFRFAETPRASSDHMSFSRHKIPVLFFFSGLHSDYHRPGDDWDRIDVGRTLEITRIVREAVLSLDQIESALTFVDLDRSDTGH